MPPLCSKLRHIAHVVSDRSWDACVPIEGDPRPPALRRGSSCHARSAAVMLICHTQLHRASANPEGACKLISRLNLPGSRCACEPLGGLGPAGGAHIHFSMDHRIALRTIQRPSSCYSVQAFLGRRIEWDGYPVS